VLSMPEIGADVPVEEFYESTDVTGRGSDDP
jgi:hypothetical protein